MSYCDHLPSGIPPSTPLSKVSETPGPIFFKLHVEPSSSGGLKICSEDDSPLINTFMSSGLFYHNFLDQSMSKRRVSG